MLFAGVFAASADPTLVNIDLDATGSSLEPFWKASVGSGHALLGLRDDWRAQLGAVHRDLGITGVRFHGSFDDDMSVVGGTIDAPVYNWTLLDALYDGIIAAGVTPIVELSFMPAVLANCTWTSDAGKVVNPGFAPCNTGMHYRHVDMPPARWTDWEELVGRVAVLDVAGRDFP